MDWIDVNDRLPTEGYPSVSYLVVLRTHGGTLPKGYFQNVDIATYNLPIEDENIGVKSSGYWEVEGDIRNYCVPFYVSHWMPLPELPEI